MITAIVILLLTFSAGVALVHLGHIHHNNQYTTTHTQTYTHPQHATKHIQTVYTYRERGRDERSVNLGAEYGSGILCETQYSVRGNI